MRHGATAASSTLRCCRPAWARSSPMTNGPRPGLHRADRRRPAAARRRTPGLADGPAAGAGAALPVRRRDATCAARARGRRAPAPQRRHRRGLRDGGGGRPGGQPGALQPPCWASRASACRSPAWACSRRAWRWDRRPAAAGGTGRRCPRPGGAGAAQRAGRPHAKAWSASHCAGPAAASLSVDPLPRRADRAGGRRLISAACLKRRQVQQTARKRASQIVVAPPGVGPLS